MDYLEYIIKTTPLRERVLSGLSLKIMALRLEGEDDAEIVMKYNKIKKMTNEEYEKFESSNNSLYNI